MKYLKIYLVLFSFVFVKLAFAQGAKVKNETTIVKYLSGTGSDDTKTWDFYCSEGRKSGHWTKIEVPSCWEQQGFGNYNYGSDKVEGRASETGIYRHKFFAPKEWNSKHIDLVFEGVMTDATVRLNGKQVGAVHQGSFYEFKYAISKTLKYGAENLLEVTVDKISKNESINHAERVADFWIFGGIYRPVYLKITPKNNIERVGVDAKANGQIVSEIFLNSRKAKDVELSLWDLKGNKIQDLDVNSLEKNKSKWIVTTKANAVKTWNPEQPNLYVLQFELKDANNQTLHQVSERIGFRTVEVLEGDGIYVNNQRIKFKGVNRHAFHPKSGRTTSKAISIEHVKMMKDMNMNAVRMSHYPPDTHFLEVCDSIGLFVIDEICTWHNPMLDTEVAKKIVKETVVRDVNHPSILLWANGNEQGWNPEVDSDYALWDVQNREVIHPWSIYKKTNTIHYSQYHSLVNDSYSKDKILFPTEFLHGLYDGGHGAGLQDYWEKMWSLPLSAGGFLWDFADEGIERTDKNNQVDLQGNKAADGIVGPYGEKEASYFTIKEIWSPIYIEDRFVKRDFNGLFRIENRYSYTNLKDCSLKAKWVKTGDPKSNVKAQVLFHENIELPDLEPGGKGSFLVNKPKDWQNADVLYVSAFDPDGHELFTWSYPVATPKEVSEKALDYNGKSKIKTTSNTSEIIIETEKVSYVFSKETGMLKKVSVANKIIPLSNGPIILNQKDKIKRIDLKKGKNKIELLVVYEEKNKSPGWSTVKEYASDTIEWTINSNGLLDVNIEFKGYRNLKGYRGVTFSFPENEVAGMKWLGDGPYRVWRNRTKGTRFQVWENDYNNTVTGESGFVYPEFKGFFSSLYWANVKGKDKNGFTVYCKSPHVYLRMLTPQKPKEHKNGRLAPEFPKGDISFVMNIPGIGTKFQNPDTMGPHGNKEHYFGNDDNPISIDLTFDFLSK